MQKVEDIKFVKKVRGKWRRNNENNLLSLSRRNKERGSFLFPLYFNWGIKITFVKFGSITLRATSKLFKSYWQEVAVLASIAVLILSLFNPFAWLAKAADLTVSANSSLTYAGGPTYSYGSVTINTGATLTLEGGVTLNISGNLDIDDSGGSSKILCQGRNTDQTSGGEGCIINVTGANSTVTIDANSKIDADGQGYAGGAGGGAWGSGPGGGKNGSGSAGGGGHGGAGSVGTNTTTALGGGANGSSTAPTDLGSGGGGAFSYAGGAGGGAIRLNISGTSATLTLNGTITADGASVSNRGGGGAGGSIYITTATLTGTGTLTADGGSSDSLGGAGGGGRVAVYYSSATTFNNYTNCTTAAGTGYATATVGTIGFFDTSAGAGNYSLTVYKNFELSSIYIGTFANITVGSSTANGATFTIGGGSILTISNTFLITGVSTSTFQGTSTSQSSGGSGVIINATNVQIDARSAIDANGQGYTGGVSTGAVGNGPGGGNIGNGSGGGGGYGGAGARGNDAAATGGSANGTSTAPTDLGSGGGGQFGYTGGTGGGAIRLNATSTLTMNGMIVANGSSVSNRAGGGAGGGTYITTATLAGTGTLTANGGSSDSLGGGGGGGRIAITYSASGTCGNFTRNVNGGTGYATGSSGSSLCGSLSTTSLSSPADNSSGISTTPDLQIAVDDADDRTDIAAQIEYSQAYASDPDCSTEAWSGSTSSTSRTGGGATTSGWSGGSITNGLLDTSGGSKSPTYAPTITGKKYYCWRARSASLNSGNFSLSNDVSTTTASVWGAWSSARQFYTNTPPEVQSVTASQNSSGTISMSYQYRDTDVESLTAALFYRNSSSGWTNNGELNNSTTTILISDGTRFPSSGTILVDNEEISYTGKTANNLTGATRGANSSTAATHSDASAVYLKASTLSGTTTLSGTASFQDGSFTWTPSTDYSGYYDSQGIFRITVNDTYGGGYAGANSSATALDTKAPTQGSVPIKVNASSTPALLTLSCSDDNSMQMKTSLSSSLSGASWATYNSTTTITLETDPDTVYGQCKDAYSNTSATFSATTPETPTNLMVQDVTNTRPSTPDYMLFTAWGLVASPSPGFSKYHVLRVATSSSGTYTEIATESTRTNNFYRDSSVSASTQYYYKFATEDSDGNTSYLSSASGAGLANGVQDYGEGGGGTEESAPTISSVATSTLTTTGVTVTWTTNEVSSSTVYYQATNSWPGASKTSYNNSRTVASYVISHSVVLSELTPATQYYFLVESGDPSNNSTTTSANTYTFTTNAGPSISNVSVAEVTSNAAKIAWNTSTSADSYVYYSTNSNLSGAVSSSSASLATSHLIQLSNLTAGNKYFFYVQSTDSSSNVASDKNATSGVVTYYDFTALTDNSGPTITNVSASLVSNNSAVITWTTDELATSQVLYGTSVNYGSQTTEDSTLTYQHSVTITGLTKETKYYYKVISKDSANNSTTNDNSSAGYTFTTTDDPGQISITYVNTGGGGGGGGSVSDSSAPSISEIEITNLTDSSVIITWKTNEESSSLVSYGATIAYGYLAGSHQEKVKEHKVIIGGLNSGKTYHYQVTSYDRAGNFMSFEDKTFTTSGISSGVGEISEELEKSLVPEELNVIEFIQNGSKAFIEQVLSILPNNPAIKEIGEEKFTASIQEMSSTALGSPIIYGEQVIIEIGPNWAKIRWVTNKKSNGLVAYAADDNFDILAKEPYLIMAGSQDELSVIHTVELKELKPSTIYHYQLQSKSQLGDWTKTADKTFATTSLSPEIFDAKFLSINEDSAIISWQTAIPTKSKIELINLVNGEKNIIEDNSYLKKHEMPLRDLKVSTNYNAQITSQDELGNTSKSEALPFSTVVTSQPPSISQIRIVSSLIPGKVERVQSVISWKTDKPATSRALYEEGITNKDLTLFTPMDSNLVFDHTVITTAFKPGNVYRFRVESADAFDNKSFSKDFTALTPKPRESVVDLIIQNFEQTFGFLNKLGL